MIDLVIPCFNAGKTLDRCLASAAMQTLSPHVILADDGSEEDVGEIAERWSRLMDISVVRLDKNSGPGAARQAGMEAGHGEYIAFMDADDTFLSALALETLAREAGRGGDVVSAGFLEELPDGGLVRHGPNMTWVFAKLYSRAFLEHFDIRFNSTRANEDTGFNTLVRGCTRAISYLQGELYLWHFREDSTTRAGSWAYAAGAGFRGYVENMIWSCGELKRRGLGPAALRDAAAEGLCGVYFAYLSALAQDTGARDRLIGDAAPFYRDVYSLAEPYIGGEYLRSVYLSAARSARETLERAVPDPDIFGFIREMKARSGI